MGPSVLSHSLLGHAVTHQELEPGGILLSAREAAILLFMIEADTDPRRDLPDVFSAHATVTITPERVRQIQSKTIGRLRTAVGTGKFGVEVREKFRQRLAQRLGNG